MIAYHHCVDPHIHQCLQLRLIAVLGGAGRHGDSGQEATGYTGTLSNCIGTIDGCMEDGLYSVWFGHTLYLSALFAGPLVWQLYPSMVAIQTIYYGDGVQP